MSSENRYALLIANGTFEDGDISYLHCPKQDVDGLYEVLNDNKRGFFSHIERLYDDDKQETFNIIVDFLNQPHIKKDDLILLYYSGHGFNRSNDLFLATSNTKKDRLRASAINYADIYSEIKESKCKRVIVILDCCFSGAASNAKGNSLANELRKNSEGYYLLTACTYYQEAKQGEKYSIFTEQIIEGIKSGDADKDSDGYITPEDLRQYCSLSDCNSQEPRYFANNVRGNIIIAESGKEKKKTKEEVEKEIHKGYVSIVSNLVKKNNFLLDAIIKEYFNFNNSLGAIPFFISEIRHDFKKNDLNNLENNLLMIENSVNNISDKINEIKTVFEKRQIDIRKILISIISYYKSNTNIKFKENILLERYELFAVYFNVNHAIQNIIENGIESLENDNDYLVVSAKNDDDSIFIEIKNIGVRIPQVNKTEIFKDGFSTKGENRGYGLTYAKILLEECNGDVDLKDSETDTIFEIKIPF